MAEIFHYTKEKNRMLLNRIAPLIETDGSVMTYKGEYVFIENFDLFLFLEENILFYQSLNAMELGDEDIFSVIRLHVLEKNTDTKQNKKRQEKQPNEMGEKEEKQEVLVKLIPYADFKTLLHRETEFTEEEQNSVALYFGFFADLIYYEDYLLPPLVSLLQDYRLFCEQLELKESMNEDLTIHEMEAIKQLRKAIDNKAINRPTESTKENIQKLVHKIPESYLDSAGSSGAILVIILVILVVVLLAGITLSLIA